MKRLFVLLPLLAGACATQPIVHDLANACASYGYLRETPEFAQCMQMEAMGYQQRQQAGWAMVAQQGMAMQQMQAYQRAQQTQPQQIYMPQQVWVRLHAEVREQVDEVPVEVSRRPEQPL